MEKSSVDSDCGLLFLRIGLFSPLGVDVVSVDSPSSAALCWSGLDGSRPEFIRPLSSSNRLQSQGRPIPSDAEGVGAPLTRWWDCLLRGAGRFNTLFSLGLSF
ncbi:hypothetical protein NPIL_333741 [Nephila pilipes]|uniref:Uncharacterized protein n=1 Tax=Nephila pilipes TaxID=299642 RepID=A0A8X6NVR1_NEPPI|nr:hypothetical protein NPIL_333741 [Nephila pilipes]